jgi:hypothetical protein
MKHKNLLLLVFFLSSFVFQQVQAGATIPSVRKPSEMNAAPAKAPPKKNGGASLSKVPLLS